MAPAERWEAARDKLCNADDRGAVPALLNHLRVHENSHWLNYRQELSEQIPTSYAAHAFRSLQMSSIHYEFIRICTFWDPVDFDSNSIPTIVELADCRGVSKCVYDDHFDHYAALDSALAKSWATKARRKLRAGVRGARTIENSEVLRAARNFRDKLAHQLEETRAEKRGPVQAPKYGDERKLLNQTVTTLNRLYLSLKGTSLDWSGSRRMHKRNAASLWKGVAIEVKR